MLARKRDILQLKFRVDFFFLSSNGKREGYISIRVLFFIIANEGKYSTLETRSVGRYAHGVCSLYLPATDEYRGAKVYNYVCALHFEVK